jgi:hypothetical protein
MVCDGGGADPALGEHRSGTGGPGPQGGGVLGLARVDQLGAEVLGDPLGG